MTRPRLRDLVFPAGGWLYRDAHYLAAQVPIGRPDMAAAWVPRPLRLARPTATLFVAWFPNSSFGSVYREAGLLLPVRHLGRRAVFSPWMVVDDDVALILGRELLGYPKKLASITWQHEGDTIDARVERRGAPLLEVSATLGERIERPPPIIGQPHRNIRSTLGLAVPWIVAFTPGEVPVEVREARMNTVIHRAERDPLAELALGSPTSARLHRVNLRRGSGPWPVGFASPIGHIGRLLMRVL